MLVIFVLNVIVLALGGIFVWLPEVKTLPEIVGYNVDGALVTGMGYFNRFAEVMWPLQIVMQGALFILAYYIIKIGLRFLLGHRAP